MAINPNYLIVVEKGICPDSVISVLSGQVIVLEISFNDEIEEIISVMERVDCIYNHTLFIGKSQVVQVVAEKLKVCVGMLREKKDNPLFVENGFCFYNWQEIVEGLLLESTQQKMQQKLAVWSILFEDYFSLEEEGGLNETRS